MEYFVASKSEVFYVLELNNLPNERDYVIAKERGYYLIN